MKTIWLVVIMLAAVGAARPASACELVYRSAFPTSSEVRLTGSVVGYVPISSTPSVNIPTIAPSWQAVGLRVAVREVVSGPVTAPEAVVAVLPYGADCRSFAANREMLERDFPIGLNVAVRGRATGSSAVPVIAESHEYEFVVNLPASLPRTPQGDLDFQNRDVKLMGMIAEFECDRAILTLANRSADRLARLRNLGQCRSWAGMSDGRARYQRLVDESGLGARERADLIEEFQRSHPLLK